MLKVRTTTVAVASENAGYHPPNEGMVGNCCLILTWQATSGKLMGEQNLARQNPDQEQKMYAWGR
jgi:hypothetical protein